MSSLLEIFEKQVDVTYKNELYSVRDNGAIMRHPKVQSKPRKLDNNWTFGTISKDKGYLLFSGEAVHRIIATAFLGNPIDASYVVDHIDTNRRNNRSDNLRWVTRFENVFLNEITRKKIELLCNCSAEEIMNDITILQKINLPPNFSWMKVVSKEEAIISKERWLKWVKEAKRREDFDFDIKKYLLSRTSNKKVGKYPLEPTGINPSIKEYSDNLKVGKIFYEKEYYNELTQFTITDFYYDSIKDILTIATCTKGGVKNNYLTTVVRKLDEFIYDTRSFFDPNSLEKYMTIAKGFEWNGGDVLIEFY